MNIETKELPNIRISVETILRRAESKKDLITYPSLLSKTGYITDLQDVMIVTRDRGYLRIKKSDLKTLMQELEWINEEVERRGRD